MRQKFSRENVSRGAKLFQENFSREATLFQGSIFQGNGGMRLPFACAGVDEYGPVSNPGPPRGPDEVAFRLERPDPCGIERSFLASTGHTHRAEYQPAIVMMAPAWSHDVQPVQRADWQIGGRIGVRCAKA